MRFSFKAIFQVRGEVMTWTQFHHSFARAIEVMGADIRREYPDAIIVDISRCPDPRLAQYLADAVEVA